jgi:predicted alpha/beta-hydrolase family hydrolase
MASDWLVDGPEGAPITFVFAHGAGAPMDAPFMGRIAAGLGARGIRVVRFEFPYMAARRESGKGGPPDRMPALVARFEGVVQQVREAQPAPGPVAVGGKSMGGRVASHCADALSAAAFVALGYPFRPPGKATARPIEHLRTMKTPGLIVQGTRDPFGGRGEVDAGALRPSVAWMEDGDHDFVPRVRSGRTAAQNWDAAIEVVATFLLGPSGAPGTRT